MILDSPGIHNLDRRGKLVTNHPAEEIYLELPGHRIACLVSRTGDDRPPLVLMHGICLSVRFWPRVIQDHALAGRNWVSVSLPGHYPSVAPDGFPEADVTPELFAAVAATAVQEIFAGRPAHLIGWSTGGFSALAAAALYPELTASVTTIAGFARGNWGGQMGLMQRLAGSWLGYQLFAAVLRLLTRHRAIFGVGLRQLASSAWQKTPLVRDVRNLVYGDFCHHDRQAMRALFTRFRHTSSADLLPKVTAPVLLIGGGRDSLISPREHRFLAESIPTARLLELKQMGHMFYAEAPDEVLNVVQEWLEEVERGE